MSDDVGYDAGDAEDDGAAWEAPPIRYFYGPIPDCEQFEPDLLKDPHCMQKWMKKLDLWQSKVRRKLPPDERATYVLSALRGDAADVFDETPASTFENDDGVNMIIEILKKHFWPKEVVKDKRIAREYYTEMLVPRGTSTQKALMLANRAYIKLAKSDMKMPERMHTLLFLEGSGLSEVQQANVMGSAMAQSTTSTVTFQQLSDVLMTMYPDKLPGVDVGGATGFMNPLRRGAASTAAPPFVRRPFTNKVNVADNAPVFDPQLDEQPMEQYEHSPDFDSIPDDVANEVNAAATDYQTAAQALDEAAGANAICAATTTFRQARSRLNQAVKARGFFKGKGAGKDGKPIDEARRRRPGESLEDFRKEIDLRQLRQNGSLEERMSRT